MMIFLIQDLARAYLIGVADVHGPGEDHQLHELRGQHYPIYLAVSLIYWGLSLVAGKIVDAATARMGKSLYSLMGGGRYEF
jgi:ABC-type amino acid transport system permease subunit